MGLGLKDEHLLIQSMVREFAEKEVAPLAEVIDRDKLFPEEIMRKMADLELTGIITPTEYGGAGSDFLSYILVMEELAYACRSTSNVLGTHTQPQEVLLAFGTEEQKAEYLPKLAKLERIGGFAITEAGAGSDAGAVATTAEPDGDYYVLNGSKSFISSADKGDLFIVIARTGPGERSKGLSAFIVDRTVSDFENGEPEEKMGFRGSTTCEVTFRNCRVPKKNLVGKIGEGFKIAMTTLNAGRVVIAAEALGLMRACLDESVSYAKQRHQFGRPLASNQAIRWMIADMQKDIVVARALIYNAAIMKDNGQPIILESACAKLFSSEAVMQHAIKAVQIHGGYGYVKGAKVEMMMRDAKLFEIFEGTSEVQRMVISGAAIEGK